jgi:hypothetical protein
LEHGIGASGNESVKSLFVGTHPFGNLRPACPGPIVGDRQILHHHTILADIFAFLLYNRWQPKYFYASQKLFVYFNKGQAVPAEIIGSGNKKKQKKGGNHKKGQPPAALTSSSGKLAAALLAPPCRRAIAAKILCELPRLTAGTLGFVLF